MQRTKLIPILLLLSLGSACTEFNFNAAKEREAKERERLQSLCIEREKARYELQLRQHRISIAAAAIFDNGGIVKITGFEKYKELLEDQNREIELKATLAGMQLEAEFLKGPNAVLYKGAFSDEPKGVDVCSEMVKQKTNK